jgi:hypothetical protein
MRIAYRTFACLLLALPAIAQELPPEARIFRDAKGSVFSVSSERGSGTGFLVDETGLILTNSHVVARGQQLAVQVDDTTRVAARLLCEDERADLAVVQVPEAVVAGLVPLGLAERPPEEPAYVGESVIVVGNPFGITRIMCTGRITGVRREALFTDADLQPGHSGGPMLDLTGQVIGVATFSVGGGRGGSVGGAVPIHLAARLLACAEDSLEVLGRMPERRLTVIPPFSYPLECLPWAARRCTRDKNYKPALRSAPRKPSGAWGRINYGGERPFDVQIITPPRQYYLKTGWKEDIARERKRKLEASGAAEENYAPVFSSLQRWRESVGEYPCVVTIMIAPKWQLTGGLGLRPKVNVRFLGDVQNVRLYRNGQAVEEVTRIVGTMTREVESPGGVSRDLAQFAILMFLPETFARLDSLTSAWRPARDEEFELRIWDAKRPGEFWLVPFPDRVIEQIWVDFEPYRDMLRDRKQPLVVGSEEVSS